MALLRYFTETAFFLPYVSIIHLAALCFRLVLTALPGLLTIMYNANWTYL